MGVVARKLRVWYPGAICLIMNRADQREPIFKDDPGRERFLETLGQGCQKTGWGFMRIACHPKRNLKWGEGEN